MSKWLKIGIAALVAVVLFALSRGESTSRVVVAARDLQAGHTLTQDDLTVVKLPASQVPKDAVTDPKQAVGQQIAVPRAQGDVIRASMLGAPAVQLAPDERGVGVQVTDPAGVGGMLKPGDLVGLVVLLNRDTFLNTIFAPRFDFGTPQPTPEPGQPTPTPTPFVQQDPGDYAKVLFEPLRVVYVSPDFQAPEVRGNQGSEQQNAFLASAGENKTDRGTVVLAVPAKTVNLVYDFSSWGKGLGKVTVPTNLVELLSALNMADGVRFSLYLVPGGAKPMTTSGVFVPSVVVLPPSPKAKATPTPKGGRP